MSPTDADQPAHEAPEVDAAPEPEINWPPPPLDLSATRVTTLLETGTVTLVGLLPWSSNYTFAVTVNDATDALGAVYKPRRGERPLWDFPRGTLCQREVAAYLVSEALGWGLVPTTCLREGPHGIGSLQRYIDADPEAHYFTFREACVDSAYRIAAFDIVINNADRKSGHVLRDTAGRVWCIDHGVTFNEEDKLRTVIWDFVGRPLPADVRTGLMRLRDLLATPGPFLTALTTLLDETERLRLMHRTNRLIKANKYPSPSGNWPSVPWPSV